MKFYHLFASAAAFCIASTSYAQTVTRTFIGNAVFTDGGPVTNAGFGFGLTYDPSGGNFFNKNVDYYNTTSSYSALNASPVTFSLLGSSIYVNGFSFGLESGRPDFEIGLIQNPPNTTPPISFSVRYTVEDNTPSHLSGDQRLNTLVETSLVTGAAAVPEPASWAMMIAGFGAVGGALRRRPRKALAIA